MRGKVAKKIRKAMKPLAVSMNDAIMNPRRFVTNIAGQEIHFNVEVRRLKTDSLKFLAGKVKGLYSNIPSTARNKFFGRLASDVQRILTQRAENARMAQPA